MFKSRELKGLIAGLIVLSNVACGAQQIPEVERNIKATVVANNNQEKVFMPENGFSLEDFERIAKSTIRLEITGITEETKNFYNSCTGVIIKNDGKSLKILTAAHCLVSPSGMSIMTSNEDLTKFNVNIYFN